MGAQVKLDDSAVRELASQLARIGDAVADLDAPNTAAAALLARGMNPPRRSGQLAAAVQVDAGPNGFTIGYPIRYATFVHWGAPHRNMRAQPWMLRQEEAAMPELERLYVEHVTDAIH